jgi:hypothetical protein
LHFIQLSLNAWTVFTVRRAMGNADHSSRFQSKQVVTAVYELPTIFFPFISFVLSFLYFYHSISIPTPTAFGQFPRQSHPISCLRRRRLGCWFLRMQRSYIRPRMFGAGRRGQTSEVGGGRWCCAGAAVEDPGGLLFHAFPHLLGLPSSLFMFPSASLPGELHPQPCLGLQIGFH